MPRMPDLWTRFRPAAAPGPAGRAAVPADERALRSAELEPVLALLDQAGDDARRIRQDAAEQADAIRRDAGARAAALVADARREATAIRGRAADAARAAARSEAARVREAAERDADAVRRRAAGRMPEYVARAVTAAVAAIRSKPPDGRDPASP